MKGILEKYCKFLPVEIAFGQEKEWKDGKSVETGKDNEILKLLNSIFQDGESTSEARSNVNGGKAFFIAQPDGQNLKEILRQTGVRFDVDYDENRDLRYLHKIINGCELFYFANLCSNKVSTSVNLRGAFNPEVWDPHTGEIRQLKIESILDNTAGSSTTNPAIWFLIISW